MKAKSIELHKLQGTYREDRHGDRVQAPMMANMPDAPGKLGPRGKELWGLKVHQLMEIGALHGLDLESLGNWCWLQEQVDILSEKVRDVENPKARYSMSKTIDIYLGKLIVLGKEFGFTLVSRSRVKVAKKKDQDKFDQI